MNKFDRFVCDYCKVHTIFETIDMLRAHRDYIEYCKYDHCLDTVKKDDNKICHINSMITFLKLLSSDNMLCDNFKTMYFGEE